MSNLILIGKTFDAFVDVVIASAHTIT